MKKECFESCKDINCISTLIKVWFRKLPKQLFGSIDPELVLKCKRTLPGRFH